LSRNPILLILSSHPDALDLVIVPGLAFTVDGKRLGHGRGYYDRFLYEYEERHGHRPRTIGLALRAQLLDDLPMERWDRRLDLVLHPPLEKHG
jgi:5-formyltetrahydrofolate cyclo-ligase